MLDLITLAAAKAISGGGSGGGVTPQQLQEALATKQDLLTAGTGIGITDDEIRVTYGESHYGDPVYDAPLAQAAYTSVGSMYYGIGLNSVPGSETQLVTENDIVMIAITGDTAADCNFSDVTAGDVYRQNVATFAQQLSLTVRYAYFRNCHGVYIAPDFSGGYLVTDAAGTEQTEDAYILALAETEDGDPLFLVLANNDYPMSGTYTISILTDRSLIPDTAYDFGAVAAGDERPVNGDTVKAAINGTGSGITLTMDAAKNLTVALRDALGQNIQTGTVNLPLESMVIGGRYADGVLYLTIIDQEEELEIPIADIVSGLVPDTRTVAGIPLSSNISAAALAAIIGGELTHVNADWNDTNPDSAAYIANKPNIPSNANWNDKYTKPSGGIPASDIARGVIPTDVSELNNDLNYATESFVNSSIATNTAFFRGTFESVSDLPSTNVSNNDYAFVISTTSGGDPEYDRYKYVVSGGSGAWQKEYTLNNSSFTAAQWAAIQSGITAQLVSKISGIPQNIVTGANGGSAIQIVVSSTAPASGTAGNILTLVTG